MRILHIGGLGTGGVSTHIKAIISEMNNHKDYNNFVYNYYTKRGWRPGSRDIYSLFDAFYKFHKITIGLFLHLSMNSYDIIHVHSGGQLAGFIPVIISGLYKNIFKYKMIITYHNSNLHVLSSNYPHLLKYGLKKGDYHITVSNIQKNILMKHKIKSNYVQINNGFDPNKVVLMDKNIAKDKLGIDNETRILTCIGWIMEKKGHIYLIKAVEKIVKNNKKKKIKLYIIGKGPLLNELRIYVRNRSLCDYIDLTGYVSNDEINIILNSSDLFILPSLEEGNPIVMFEALGVGLPIIGTNVGGIPDIIISIKYGLVVKSKDYINLKKSIIKGLNSEYDKSEIIEYSKNFYWSNVTNKILEIYDVTYKGD